MKASIAFSCMLGFLFGLAMTNTGFDGGESMVIWLVYTVSAGMIINSESGYSSSTLLKAAFPSATVMAMTSLYRIHVYGVGYFSGLTFTNSTFDYVMIAGTWALSVVGIWLFAHGRNRVFDFFERANKVNLDDLKKRLAVLTGVLTSLAAITHLVVG